MAIRHNRQTFPRPSAKFSMPSSERMRREHSDIKIDDLSCFFSRTGGKRERENSRMIDRQCKSYLLSLRVVSPRPAILFTLGSWLIASIVLAFHFIGGCGEWVTHPINWSTFPMIDLHPSLLESKKGFFYPWLQEFFLSELNYSKCLHQLSSVARLSVKTRGWIDPFSPGDNFQASKKWFIWFIRTCNRISIIMNCVALTNSPDWSWPRVK